MKMFQRIRMESGKKLENLPICRANRSPIESHRDWQVLNEKYFHEFASFCEWFWSFGHSAKLIYGNCRIVIEFPSEELLETPPPSALRLRMHSNPLAQFASGEWLGRH